MVDARETDYATSTTTGAEDGFPNFLRLGGGIYDLVDWPIPGAWCGKVEKVGRRWRAFLRTHPDDDRPLFVQVGDAEGYQGRAVAARAVMDAFVSIVHACPVGDEGITPCCERVPFALAFTDRLTEDPALVTCTGTDNESCPPSPDPEVA